MDDQTRQSAEHPPEPWPVENHSIQLADTAGPGPDGWLPAGALASEQVTVLDVHGPLYFAAARTLRERLPQEDTAHRAVVVLRIRDNTQIGATFIEEITDYARTLSQRGGRLYLCGMTTRVSEMMKRSGRLALDDEVVLVPGEEVLGASLKEAVRQADAYLRGE